MHIQRRSIMDTDDIPKTKMNPDSIILSIINAGYNGHQYVNQSIDKTDPYYIQFKYYVEHPEAKA